MFGDLIDFTLDYLAGSREPLPVMKHLGNERSFQIYSSDLCIVVSLKGKDVRAKSWPLFHRVCLKSPSAAMELLWINSNVTPTSGSGSSRESHWYYIIAIADLKSHFFALRRFSHTQRRSESLSFSNIKADCDPKDHVYTPKHALL